MTHIRRIINNPHSWWAIVIIILVFGAVVYLIGHDLGLPLYESKDERRNLHEVFALRNISDDALWKPGYPPGILYVNHLAQYATEFTTQSTALYERCLSVLNVRRMGIIINLASALIIALIARRLAGDIAGLVAIIGWLFNEHILLQTQFGFPQTYELFAYLLAMYLALLAVDIPDTVTKPNTQYGAWAILSVAAGLLAVLFKYTSFPVLGLGVGASLWNLRRNRSLWLKVLGIQFVLITLCAVWLFIGYDALRLVRTEHVETNLVVSGTGFVNLSNGSLWLERYQLLAQQAGLAVLPYALILIIGSVFFLRQAKPVLRMVYLVIAVLMVTHITSLMIMLATINEGERQNLPITGYSSVLIAVAIISIFRRLPHRWNVSIGMLCLALWLTQNIYRSVQYVMWRDQPVSYAELVAWAGETLPPQDRLLVHDIRPFTDEWSCYTGIQHPNVSEAGFIRDEQSIIDLRNDDYAFVQIDEEQRQELEASDIGRIALGEMTLIAQIPPPEEANQWRTWRRGFPDHRLTIYSIIPMEEPTNTQFGDNILLHGYTIDVDDDTLVLHLYWEALASIASDYQLFVNLIAPDDGTTLIAEDDLAPTGNSYRPTSTWYRAGEIMLVGRVDLELPSGLAYDNYVLDMGLYNTQTGHRLMTNHGYESMGIVIELDR